MPVEQDQDVAAAGSPAASDAPDAAAAAAEHAADAADADAPGNSAGAPPAAAAESNGSHGSAGEGQAGLATSASSSDQSGAPPAMSFDTAAMFEAAVRAHGSSDRSTAQAMNASAATATDHEMFEQMQHDDLGVPAGLDGPEAGMRQQQAAQRTNSQVRLDLQMQQLLQDAAAAGFYRGSPPPALPDTPESLPAGAHLSAQLQAAASLAGAAGMDTTGMAPDPVEPSAAEGAGWGLGMQVQRRAAARRISLDGAGVNGLVPQLQRHSIRPVGGRVGKPQRMGFHSRVAVLEDMIRTQRRIMGEVLELLNMERTAIGLPPFAFGAGADAGADIGAQLEDSAVMEGTQMLVPPGEYADRFTALPASDMPNSSCPAQLETYSSLSPHSSVGLGFEAMSNTPSAGLAPPAGGMPAFAPELAPAAHASAQALGLGLGANAAGASGMRSNGSAQQYGAEGAPGALGMSAQGAPAGILGSSNDDLDLRLLRLQQNSLRASAQLQQELAACGLTATAARTAAGYAGAEMLHGAGMDAPANPSAAAFLQAGTGARADSGMLPGSSAPAAVPSTAMSARSAQDNPMMLAHWPAGQATSEGVPTQLGQFTRRPPVAEAARRYSLDSAQAGTSMVHGGILAGPGMGMYASKRPGLKRSSTGTPMPQALAGSARTGQLNAVPQYLRAQAAAGTVFSDVYASAAAPAGSFGGPAASGDTAGLGVGAGVGSMPQLLQAHSAPLPGSVRASFEGFASGPAGMQGSMRQHARTPSAQAVFEMLNTGLGTGRLDVYAAASLLYAQQGMGGLAVHQASSLAIGAVVGSAMQYQMQGQLEAAHSFTPSTGAQDSQHLAAAANAQQQELVQRGMWHGAAEGQQLQAAHHAGALQGAQRPAAVAVPNAAGDASMADGDVHWYDDDVLVALIP